MFTLCGLILEAVKIYFGIFGVRLVFLFIFLPSGIIKTTNRLQAVPERDTARGQPLNSAAPSRPSPSAPPRSARAAGAAAADDPAARGSSRLVFRTEKKRKKNSAFVVFLFPGLNPRFF